MVNSDSQINSLNDLAGKKVAVQTDTPVQKALTKGGARYADLGSKFRKLVVVPNYNNAIMELEAGSVDAVALDIGVAQDKMKSGSFRMLDEVVISEKYGIGFAKGNRKLRDAVQKTLLEMVKDGTAAKISAKYFNGRDVLIIGK
jgi:polar amino acid transport system substrate-binding protein